MSNLKRLLGYGMIVLAWITMSMDADAQLILGGNISWQCLGSNQYTITLTQYRDCSGSPGDPGSVDVFFYPSGCGGVAFSANLPLTNTVEISDLCPTELPNSTCSGVGATPGTVQVTYTGTVTLTAGCTWNAYYNAWDYSVLYENQNPVFQQDSYLLSVIDTNAPCGTSPNITSSPSTPQVPYLCAGVPYVHNAFVNLPAGYSCTYSLTDVYTSGATPGTFVTTSGFAQPSGLTISAAGIINWTPPAEGYYITNIEIDIFNGATHVGTMYETMSFIVRDCTPTNTEFTSPDVSSVGTATTLSGSNNLTVCAGDSLVFTVTAENPELFRAISIAYTPVAGLPFTFSQTGVNPAIGTFRLLTNASMVAGSPYVLTVNAEDDACPNPDTDQIQINITIAPNIHLNTNDTIICAGQNVNLSASGLPNNNYTWAVLAGGDNTPALAQNVASQNVTPDFTTLYEVSSAIVPAGCVSRDTVEVNVSVSDLNFAVNGESCGNLNGSIDLIVVGGSGSYSFDWTGTGVIDNQEDQSNLNGGPGANYSVLVTDLVAGCTRTENTSVSEIAAPTLTFNNDTTICQGQSVNLVVNFTAGTGPFSIDFTTSPTGGLTDQTAAPDPYTISVSPTQTTTYTIVSVTDAFGCVANINDNLVVNVRQPVTATLAPEAAICANDPLDLTIDFNQSGTYSVVYSTNGTNQPAVVVADGGTIDVTDPTTSGTVTYDIESVSYNDAPLPACPSTDGNNGNVQVTVNPLPTATLSGGGSICSGSCRTLTIQLTGTGPWTVNYTLNGVAQTAINIPIASAPGGTYAWSVCPTANSIFCLTSVSNATCSNTISNECETVTVNSIPVVNYTLSANQVCSGNCVNANVSVVPAGNITLVFTDTPNLAGFGTFTNVTSPFSQAFCPTANSTLRLDSVYYTGNPQCAALPNQTLNITVNGNISVTATDTICNNIGTTYQVQYTVTGGTLPYDELPGGTGGSFNAAGNIYTSTAIDSGTAGGTWTFSDGNDCNSVTMNMGLYSCPVLSNAGSMSATPIIQCATGNVISTASGSFNNNAFLDGNDQQMFVLHTASGTTPGIIIATDCDDANFGDADSPLSFGAASGANTIISGTTYYISSVVGDGSGAGVGGCVNLNAANVQVSPGQPVTWFQRPTVVFTIDDTELCTNECANLQLTVSPVQPFSASFTSNPANAAATNYSALNSPWSQQTCPTAATTFTLGNVYYDAAPQCSTVVNQSITVNVNQNVVVTPTDTICNNIGTQYQVQYTVSGGELPYDEIPTGANGTFNAAGTVFTSALINSGSPAGPYTFSDVNDCNSVTVSMGAYSCPVLTNAGTMSITPIVICGGQVNANSATGVWNNNGFQDGNDEQMFILHTTSNNSQGTIIATDCDDAIFGDADSPLTFGAAAGPNTIVSGVTYYISSVVGDAGAGAGGCVNMAAPNRQIANGQPVTWYQQATATLSTPNGTSACQNESVALVVTVTGVGPWTVVYSINGTNQPAITIPAGLSTYNIQASAPGQYCLVSVTTGAANCAGVANGCANVVINPLPTATIDGDGVTCAGIDYCFNVALTGTAPWTLSIDDPTAVNQNINATSSNPYTLCSAIAGSYQVLQVTDGNGCVSASPSNTVTLTVNTLPTSQWAFGDTSFCAGSCLSLNIVNGGASNFSLNIISADPALTNASVQNVGPNATVTVCEPGNYTIVSITDANGCTGPVNDILQITEIATPTADAGIDLEQCLGTAVTLGTPGVAGVNYIWAPTIGMASGESTLAQPTVNPSGAGITTYTLTASSGQCSSTDDVVLTTYALPTIFISAQDDTICLNTCTDITAAGATTYQWTNTASIASPSNQATITVCPTVSETYEVTGYESHATIQCVNTNTISVVVGNAITTTVEYSDELCYQTCSGFADFTPQGGFSPYQINGSSNLSWTNLCAGPYNYTITDAQGCTLNGAFSILERPQEIIDNTTPANPTCFGEETGSISLIDAAATSFDLLSINTGAITSDASAPFNFSNLGAGSYEVTMAVELGSGLVCYDTALVTLTPISPQITLSTPWTSDIFCYLEPICMQVDMQGGSGVLQAHWNSCPQASLCEISNVNPLCFTLDQDTAVYVYATDLLGCTSDTIQINASLYPDLFVEIMSGLNEIEVCEYVCQDLSATTSGGNGNQVLTWYQLPQNSVQGFGDTLTVCPVFTVPYIDYYVIADDGCSTPVGDSIRVIIHDSPEVLLSSSRVESCYPDTISFAYVIDTSFTDNYSCTWVPGYGQTYTYCGDTTFLYNAEGTFIPAIVITSQYGCVGSDSLNQTPIVMHGHPEVDFSWRPDPVDVLRREVHFINATQGATDFLWNFYSAGTSEETNPVWTFPDIETDTPYEVCLYAINQFGCSDTLCKDITVDPVLQTFVPNAFTPDGDGINDVFLPIVQGIVKNTYKCWVFNRWGDPVFYTEDPDQAWTGGNDNGEYFIQDGIYTWRIECVSLYDNEKQVFEGFVALLR
jgi:hypothetical protein